MKSDPCRNIKVEIEKTNAEIRGIEKEIKDNKRGAETVGNGEELPRTYTALNTKLYELKIKMKNLIIDLNNCKKENRTDL